MDIFQTVRQAVTAEAVAERYGLRITHGKALCPFHRDTHPSLSFKDDFFYCFVCGAGGDATALTARIFDLTPIDAARKICADFSLDAGRRSTAYEIASSRRLRNDRVEQAAWEEKTATKLCYCLVGVRRVLRQHVGMYPTDDLMIALQIVSRLEYLTDILCLGEKGERDELYHNHRKEIESLVRQAHQIT